MQTREGIASVNVILQDYLNSRQNRIRVCCLILQQLLLRAYTEFTCVLTATEVVLKEIGRFYEDSLVLFRAHIEVFDLLHASLNTN